MHLDKEGQHNTNNDNNTPAQISQGHSDSDNKEIINNKGLDNNGVSTTLKRAMWKKHNNNVKSYVATKQDQARAQGLKRGGG